MTRFVSTSIALSCLLVLFAFFAFYGCSTKSGPSTATVNCGNSSTKELVDAAYDAILAKGISKDEWWKFNITANRATKTVTITGWSDRRGDVLDAVQAVENQQNNCTVDYANFFPSRSEQNRQFRVGCPQNYVPCGDICVLVNESCKITSEMQAQPGSAPVCKTE